MPHRETGAQRAYSSECLGFRLTWCNLTSVTIIPITGAIVITMILKDLRLTVIIIEYLQHVDCGASGLVISGPKPHTCGVGFRIQGLRGLKR